MNGCLPLLERCPRYRCLPLSW